MDVTLPEVALILIITCGCMLGFTKLESWWYKEDKKQSRHSA